METKSKKKNLRGDTLVEVMFAVGIFGIIAVSAISLMNRGVNTAQTALETEMARNEIDAQAEAIRFIHSAYAAEYTNKEKEYQSLWDSIKARAIKHSDLTNNTKFFSYPSSIKSCEHDDSSPETAAYDNGVGIITDSTKTGGGKKTSFIIDTHKVRANAKSPDEVIISATDAKVKVASTYPRLIYDENAKLNEDSLTKDIVGVEGIWVTAVRSDAETRGNPQYYDFYIRTCWNSPGRGDPMTISTTIRLYNPDAK